VINPGKKEKIMGKSYEGSLLGKGLKFGLVVSRFNEFFTRKLLEGAQDALLRHGVNEADIEVAWTPGSFEIPLVVQKMAQSKKYDALICLAAVIRGGTPHWEYIASEATKGIARVSLETGVPVVNSILTTETLEQAIERSGSKGGNKGFDAAVSAIETANLLKAMG
jgi:6,7-dimethyl-8-ribityllumazine synthase